MYLKSYKMKYFRLILLIIFIVCTSFTTEHDSHSFTMQHGLCDNTVVSILKDSKGFMWFGTSNGLSRYDGNNFKNYYPNNQYMQIDEMAKATQQCFAFLSARQLCFFNHLYGKFIPIEAPAKLKNLEIRHLYPSVRNYIWAISSDRLMLLKFIENKDKSGYAHSIKTQLLRSIPFALDAKEGLSQICYSKSRNCFYLVSNRGHLFRYDFNNHRLNLIATLSDGVNYISFTGMIQSDGFLWISTIDQGIFRYDINSGSIDSIRDHSSLRVLSHNDVYQILSLGNHQYIAVTWSGYTIITLDRNNLKHYTTEIIENPSSSSQHYLENRMLTGYYDTSSRIFWIGTRGGGVYYVDLRLQYYNVTHQTQHNEICGIVSDNKKYVWLATFHNGIMKSKTPYERGKSLEFVTVNPVQGVDNKTVLCAMKDFRNELWFGYQNGTLANYSMNNGRLSVRKLRLPNNTINDSPIWAIYQDSNHRFWIGTPKALYLYDEANNTLQAVLDNLPFVRCITGTPDKRIWIGTDRGLCRIQMPARGKAIISKGYEKRIHSLSDMTVRSILAASDGNLYVGYGSGLAIIDTKLNKINSFFTTRDGLSNNYVGCIANDDKGHIWIGNASSISRFSRHQHIFYNFYISGNNRSVMYMDHTLFFGNNRNLTYVYPEEMKLYLNKQYNVQFTGIKVANRLINVGEIVNGQRILQQDLSAQEKIVLSNKNRDFSILFNNLCYSEDLQKYNYRLTPYQKNWLVLNEKGEVSYTNLPEGDYVFEVCCIYPDGSTGNVTRLNIVIEPHWSHTLLFRLFILLLIIGIVAYLIRYFNQRKKRLMYEMQMKNELLKLNMDWERERQIRKERENFFTGVAHELRTPLTLILSPLMELLHQTKADNSVYPQLERMYKNGTSLQSLVNQLLYVQKIEAGMVKLQLSEVDIVQIITDVVESFRELADFQHCTLTSNITIPSLSLWIDVEKIISAVKNLLSNAFKYTPQGGSVSVTVEEKAIDEGSFCILSVSDTGVGMPKEDQEHIFDSFITGVNRPNYSTKVGIGLYIVKNTVELHHGLIKLESEPGKGSTFKLYIPTGKEHFVNDSYEIVAYDINKEAIPDVDISKLSFAPSTVESDTNKSTILVVEDNIDMRRYICSLFSSRYHLLEAGNGKEGIDLATANLPLLVITDVMMPVMNGFQCVRILRQQSQTSHIPILMLTAKAEDVDVLKGLESGVDDYMMKPFNPEVLKAKAESLIQLREHLKQIYTKSLMLKSTTPEASEYDMDVFMQQVINLVEANLSDVNFNVKILAEKMNMSQPTLFRKLKQHTDLSVIEIIRSIRVTKAAALLMEKQHTVQEISELVGFNDVRTLRKHFMNKFGVSPSNFMDKE